MKDNNKNVDLSILDKPIYTGPEDASSIITIGLKSSFALDREHQKEIDINKAVKWLKNELSTKKTADHRYPTDVVSKSYFTAEELIEDFRKAMEGGEE